jgi:hypothetical protein
MEYGVGEEEKLLRFNYHTITAQQSAVMVLIIKIKNFHKNNT